MARAELNAGGQLTPHCSGLVVSRCAPSFSPLNSISLDAPGGRVRCIRVSLGLAVVGFALLSCAKVAAYCACKGEPSVSEALAKSDVVFTGSVSAIGLDYAKQQRITTFRVARVFKGAASNSVRVTSAIECEYNFARDGYYLVFANRSSGRLYSGLCSGSRPISPASPAPPELGAGRPPSQPAP